MSEAVVKGLQYEVTKLVNECNQLRLERDQFEADSLLHLAGARELEEQRDLARTAVAVLTERVEKVEAAELQARQAVLAAGRDGRWAAVYAWLDDHKDAAVKDVVDLNGELECKLAASQAHTAMLKGMLDEAVEGGLRGLRMGCSPGFACPWCGSGNSGHGLKHSSTLWGKNKECLVLRHAALAKETVGDSQAEFAALDARIDALYRELEALNVASADEPRRRACFQQLREAQEKQARILSERFWADGHLKPGDLDQAIAHADELLAKHGKSNEKMRADAMRLRRALESLRLDGVTDLGWEGVQRQNVIVNEALAATTYLVDKEPTE